MKSRFTAWMNITLIAVVVALAIPSVGLAQADDDPRTEDIVYMADGRVLHGQILSETQAQVIFQYIDRKLNLQTKLTLARENIDRIDRDVPIEDPIETKVKGSSRSKSATTKPGEWSGYGHFRVDSDAENVPSFYIVPMKGQMGTDIHSDVYQDIVDDIKAHDPDYLILAMKCQDTEDRLYTRWGDEEKGLHDINFLDVYRDLVNLFRDDLRAYPQVLWIEDSQGISSVIAMAWDNLYMKPEARLGGIADVRKNFNVSDPEVYAKFREANMSLLKGFSEYGGYSPALIDAMVLPEYSLSASFKGREVEWSLTADGEFVIDNSDKRTVDFEAKSAEDLLISDGTAEDLDDLALLMGFREYRVIQGRGEDIIQNYIDNWRRSLEKSKTLWADYGQHISWASGDETLKWLGRAKRDVEGIIKAIDRYEAVEIRLGAERGLNRFGLVTIVEQLKERIRALRQQRGTRGRGGGGMGTGGG